MLLIVPIRYFCGGSFCFVLVFKFFLCCWRLCVFSYFLVKLWWLGGRLLGGWLLVWLAVCFVVWVPDCWFGFFSHLGFRGGGLLLIAPFPDLCLLVPFSNPIPEKMRENHFYTILCVLSNYRPNDNAFGNWTHIVACIHRATRLLTQEKSVRSHCRCFR